MRLRFAFLMICMLSPLVVSGCAAPQPKKPAFQPLALDLSGGAAASAANPMEGADVYCAFTDGTALIDRQWRAYARTGFTLPGNGALSSITIPAARGGASTTMRAYFDLPGQKMIFCPLTPTRPGGVIECESLYAMSTDIQDGIKRTFDVPNAVQNAHISCAYSKDKLPSL